MLTCKILDQSQVSDDRGFRPWNRQVANNLASLLYVLSSVSAFKNFREEIQ